MQGQMANTERGLNPALMTQRDEQCGACVIEAMQVCLKRHGVGNESVDKVLRIFPGNREPRPLAVIRIAGFDGLIAKL